MTSLQPIIRLVADEDIEELVQLSLAAWAPVFRTFEEIYGPRLYRLLRPEGLDGQRAVVEDMCRDRVRFHAYLAEVEGRAAGFVVVQLRHEELMGEVQLLAVHPDFQNQGVAAALNEFALHFMRKNGMKVAMVETGGDPSHAPARRSYEKAGYTLSPIARYFKDLTE